MNTPLILEDDIRDADAAAQASSLFEQLALRAELAQHEQAKTSATWVLTYHVPGMAFVRLFLHDATRQDVMERIDEEIGLYLATNGLVARDVVKASCPVRVAFARYASNGSIHAEGNWPQLMRAAARSLGAHMSAQAVSDGPDDMSELEVFTTNGKPLNG